MQKLLFICLFLWATNGAIAQNFEVGKINIIHTAKKQMSPPVFSPDGKYIAFSTYSGGIQLLDRATNKVSSYETEKVTTYQNFTWSLDSEWVAFHGSYYEPGPERHRKQAILVFNPTTKEFKRVTPFKTNGGGHPKWQYRGKKKLLLHSTYLTGQVLPTSFSGTIKGGNTITELLPFPAKESDLNRVFLWKDKHIYERQKGKTVQVTNERSLPAYVSPNGKQLLYTSYGKADVLVAMTADGEQRVEIAKGFSPSWSPDGKYMVFYTPIDSPNGERIATSDVFVMKADGTNIQQITFTDDVLEQKPIWSPDGESIVFSAYRKTHLYEIKIKPKQTTQVQNDNEITLQAEGQTLQNANDPLSLNLYPNPTISQLQVEIDTKIPPKKIFISNVQGKLIKSIPFTQKSMDINVSNLTAGTYFLSVLRADNRLVTKRFIKMTL